jgi:DNA-binding NtrC family response regulator
MSDGHQTHETPARRRVLVIDDHTMIHAVSTAMLEHLGYEALTAINGADGISLFRQHQLEILCVLLDMTMPGMSGMETLTTILAIRPDTYVVLMSGYGEDSMVMEQVGGHTIRFLSKPFTVADLSEHLRQAAGR